MTLTCACLVLASVGLAVSEVRDFVAGMAASAVQVVAPQAVELASMAETNADHASVTLTNPQSFTAASRCFRPVVKNKGAGTQVEGALVCSGELKPKTTVTIQAPYEVGAVLKTCSRDGRYGPELDWSQCTFDVEAK